MKKTSYERSADLMRRYSLYCGLAKEVFENLQAAAMGAAQALEHWDGTKEHAPDNPLNDPALEPLDPPDSGHTLMTMATFKVVENVEPETMYECIGQTQRMCSLSQIVVDAPGGAKVLEVRVGKVIVWHGECEAMKNIKFAPHRCPPGVQILVVVRTDRATGAIACYAEGLPFPG